MVTIEQYTEKYHNDVVTLITSIQQNEFNIPITYEQQPDLADIKTFYDGFWIATDNHHCIGTIGLKLIEDFGVIRKMFVHKDFRGSTFGVAQKLLTTLESECIKRKIAIIYLGTTDFFKAAHKFYEKNGYLEIHREELPNEFPIMHVDTKFYCKKLIIS